MLSPVVAVALAILAPPVPAKDPAVFVAINAMKASGFKTLAECERAIGGARQRRGTALADHPRSRGSLFNRKAGNTTRCEMVGGEPLVVVYPKGHAALAPPR